MTAQPAAGVVIPTSSLPADSDPDRADTAVTLLACLALDDGAWPSGRAAG